MAGISIQHCNRIFYVYEREARARAPVRSADTVIPTSDMAFERSFQANRTEAVVCATWLWCVWLSVCV